MDTVALTDDGYCVVCGELNPIGLGLLFKNERGVISTEFVPGKHHQGYAAVVHGGIVALVFDEIMVQTLWQQGRTAVSVDFKMRLRRPAFIAERLLFRAWIERERRGIIQTQAECYRQAGDLIASARALCREITGLERS